MLDQLVIARSYMEIDRVDLVRAGEFNCGKRSLVSGFFKQCARAAVRHGLAAGTLDAVIDDTGDCRQHTEI